MLPECPVRYHGMAPGATPEQHLTTLLQYHFPRSTVPDLTVTQVAEQTNTGITKTSQFLSVNSPELFFGLRLGLLMIEK